MRRIMPADSTSNTARVQRRGALYLMSFENVELVREFPRGQFKYVLFDFVASGVLNAGVNQPPYVFPLLP